MFAFGRQDFASGLRARPLSGAPLPRLPGTSEAVHDPSRHFALVIYRNAKGSFGHLVGLRKQ
jgi:hypothetical protein